MLESNLSTLRRNRRWARVLICAICLLATDCVPAPVVSPTPRATLVEDFTLVPTQEPVSTLTFEPTEWSTNFTEIPSVSYTATQTETATLEPTFTEVFTPTNTPTLTALPTPTRTPMRTATMFVTLLRTPTPTSTQVTPPAPPIGDVQNFIWFGKNPSVAHQLEVGTHFDATIMHHLDEYIVEDWRDAGMSGPFLMYIRSEAIDDRMNLVNVPNPLLCGYQPFRNNAAYVSGDICDIRDNHPDWFLRDINGNVIRTGDGFILMDMSNPGWRAFFVERLGGLLDANQIWDGVHLDNVSASLKNVGNVTLRDYPNVDAYTAAIENWIAFLYTTFFQPRGEIVSANITHLSNHAVWYRYMRWLDIGQNEGSFVGWNDDYISVSQWNAQLVLAETTLAQGKAVIFTSQGEGVGTRHQFAYASFLLIANGQAWFRYADASHYALYIEYPIYELQLGSPLGPRRLLPDGVTWERIFQRGTVRVNPVTHIGTITVINP